MAVCVGVFDRFCPFQREGEERGDEEEEKGGPYPRNHYAA